MLRREQIMRTVLAVLLCVSIATPSFASPVTQPTTIIAESFETSPSTQYSISQIIDHLHPGDGNLSSYWGRITTRKRTGSYSMWVAGNEPARTTYRAGNAGRVRFSIPQLVDYYSAEASFWYTMLSRGSGDSESFAVEWIPQSGDQQVTPGNRSDFGLTSSNVWVPRTVDLSGGHEVSLSRDPGNVDFRFFDNRFEYYAPFTGQGPSIDDIAISGFKYGPVRSLAGTVSGTAQQLSWKRPYRSFDETITEERPIGYRIWRAPSGTSSWTELTSDVGASPEESVTYSTPIVAEGVQYRYSVQSWDVGTPAGTGAGAGYGYGRSTDMTLSVPVVAPTVTLGVPVNGFRLTLLPVAISGTAADVGVGVANVQVRIRRADGRSWSGTSWVTSDAWVNAQSADGWNNWTYSWQPDAEILALGQIVTVSARSRDRSNTLSAIQNASSSNAPPPTVSLAGGAAHTTSRDITATIVADGEYVRYSVDGGSPTAWAPVATSMPVALTGSDGTKTVGFQFSADSGTSVFYSTTKSILLHTSKPEVQVTSLRPGFQMAESVSVSGTASDAGGAVSSVMVRIRRSGGTCWNGSAWVANETWLPAETTDGYAHWSLAWVPDQEVLLSGESAAVSVRAADGFGLVTSTGSVTSAVSVAAALQLADGDSFTTTTTVAASISATGAPAYMRYRIDGAPFTDWVEFSAESTVALSATDGSQTVTFEVRNDDASVASTSDSVVLHTSTPAVAFATPSEGFPAVGTVAISGTATDAGGVVGSVRICIRRGDGASWNGLEWTTAEVWIPVTSDDGFATWSYLWTVDPADAILGEMLSVSARASDGFGLVGQTAPVFSAVMVAPTISLADGAPYTANREIPVSVSAVGATHMRLSGGDAPAEFETYSSQATVTLGAAEGEQVVRFDFSLDGVEAYAAAEDSIVLDETPPDLQVAGPLEGFTLELGEQVISGVVSDAASGVDSVRIRLTRSGMSWNGFGWQESEYWLTPVSEGGAWMLPWSPLAGDVAGYDPVLIDVEATDLVGNTSTSRVSSVDPQEPTKLVLGASAITISYGGTALIQGTLKATSDVSIVGRPVRLQYYTSTGWKYGATTLSTDASGAVAYPVKPVNKTQYRLYFGEDADYSATGPTDNVIVSPKVQLAAPYAPSSIRHGVAFSTYGFVRPRHSSGYPVRIYRERYVSGKWKSYGYTTLRAARYSSYSKYSGRLTFPSAGKWRLRAYVPADSQHATTYGSYTKTVVVR